jgi:hypothetical protein
MEEELTSAFSMMRRAWKLIHELDEVIFWCGETRKETQMTREWLNAVVERSRTADIKRLPVLSSSSKATGLQLARRATAPAHRRPDFILPRGYTARTDQPLTLKAGGPQTNLRAALTGNLSWR